MYDLNEEENVYLNRVILYTKFKYLKKNKYNKIEEENIEDVDEKLLVSDVNIEKEIEKKEEKETTAPEIEKMFENNMIYISAKSLTLREKLVIFLCYFEHKTDKEIAKELECTEEAIRKVRSRAVKKIYKRYCEMKGSDSNV